ncbi:uncharacterized mitochondrial protein AtMg00810-like [Vicia villosa]|uniref:uncharacterized mitochondrial protein AtMg00810-like n=1 Tax=Vicia villosa TaxID=3911 RepID=UPI00273C79E0|nr:uncharacterized mitochondrial protein AtMg00810-like [Vicia villosa]
MQEELEQFRRNEVWDLVPRLEGTNVIEAFAPVAHMESIKLLLGVACILKFKPLQMDDDMVKHFVKQMQSEFETSLVGKLTYFLGLQIKQMEDSIFLCQEKYANNIVKKFGMENSTHKRTTTPTHLKLSKDEKRVSVDQSLSMSMILLYLTASRPYITFVVGVYARHQAEPKISLLNQVKIILKYVNGTCDYGILYSHDPNSKLLGHCDADWAGSADDRRSNSGACFFLGNNLISWFNKK